MKFENPEFLWLMAILPLLIGWKIYKNKKAFSTIMIPSVDGFEKAKSIKTKLRPFLFALRIAALACLIVALSRPYLSKEGVRVNSTEGIDIVLSVDVSGSMLSQDLKPNRLEALKKVASQFIKDRTSDRIGLVVYAGEAYTKIPVTADKPLLLKSLSDIKFAEVEDGTAIGFGLATAINRLKESKAKSKVVILMTDGINNTGFIDPLTASDLAKMYNIKVYTVGIGTNGVAMSPVQQNPDGSFVFAMTQVQIDEALLKNIASATKGKYFRATSNKKLEEIYKEIDKLEKSEIEEFKFYQTKEEFRPWVIVALACIVIEFVLKYTYFKGIS